MVDAHDNIVLVDAHDNIVLVCVVDASLLTFATRQTALMWKCLFVGLGKHFGPNIPGSCASKTWL